MKELSASLNGNFFHNKDIIPFEKTQVQPKLKFNPDNKYYSIIMVDPDAPSSKNPIYKYVLHWLVINNSEIILDFMPPAPPFGSGFHRYYINLFEQPNKIKLDEIPERHKFDLESFVQKYKL